MLNSIISATLPIVPKKIVEKIAKPYIAGENLSEAINTVKQLNSKNAMATIDVLGEDVFTNSEAAAATKKSLEVLDAISNENLNANLSLKLTHLGLKLGFEICKNNLFSIIDSAKEKNIFVRIDMENHTCTDDTIKLFNLSHNRFEKTGIVIQSYLKRSEADIISLVKEKTNFRLCKGIYNEPKEIAFKKRAEIQNNFLNLLDLILSHNCYVGIATHDDVLIDGSKKIIQKKNISNNEFEFQMLLGVRIDVRDKLINENNKMRIYTPFGKDWYAYSIRRLKENPQIAMNVLKAVFTKK